MNENQDNRIVEAAMKSLFVRAPASLKNDLKRIAREQRAAPSIWAGLAEALSGGAWAYGAGAVFAAAAVGVFVLRAVPDQDSKVTGKNPEQLARQSADVPQSLRDMWSDDDGDDSDDI